MPDPNLSSFTPDNGALIVVARLDSRRVPGKGLLDLGGMPLLARTCARLRCCTVLDRILIATSDRPTDDPIAAFAADAYFPVYRGDAQDVARRIHRAARDAGLDWFVRICGDSPFIDPETVDRVAGTFIVEGPDICTNVHPRTYPIGNSAEAVAVGAMERLLTTTDAQQHREHVTAWFYENETSVRIVNVAAPDDRYAGSSIAVDWPEDVEMARWILTQLDDPATATLDRIVDLERAWRASRKPALAGGT